MRSSPLSCSSTAVEAQRSADLQLAWLDACDDVSGAYLTWRDADRPDRTAAFLVYHAALDREEAAARALELHLHGRGLRRWI